MPLPLLGAAAIAAGGSLLGSALGAHSQSSTNKANMKLAQYQNSWNLEQWNRENEYNSPLQQMARLEAAGLNPNMVYGNGSAANQAANSPRAEAPHLEAFTKFGDLGASEVINSLLTAKQLKNLDQQNYLLQVDAAAKRQEMLNRSIAMSKQIMENAAYRDDYKNARELSNLAVKNARSNIAHTDASISKLNVDTQLTTARVQLAKMQNLMSKAQYTKLVRLLPYEIRKLSAETSISEKMAKDYASYGVRPNDPLWARVLAKLLPEAGVSAQQEIIYKLNSLPDDASWSDIKNEFPE